MPNRKLSVSLAALAVLAAGCLAAVLIYQQPTIQERLGWRMDAYAAKLRRIFNRPEQVVFIPAGASPAPVETLPEVIAVVQPETTSDFEPSATPAVAATASTPEPEPTSTLSPTPLPNRINLSGIVHEYQQFNNCGPANLAMALSFWGWPGDQRVTRSYLRPNLSVDDKNVNPAEMVDFVEQFSELKAVARVGGDLDLLRSLLSAGFPVLIEAGHHPPDDWWMGHYLVVSGYDDDRRILTVQDSLLNPNLPMGYEELAMGWWRDFNYVYILIFPVDRQEQAEQILGARVDPSYSYQVAAQNAIAETAILQGRDQFFAWFNLGASLVGLEDFGGAAQAYDQAFNIYQSLPEDLRPYRLMWYQDGAYAAYYHTGRFQDVVDLANTTFTWAGQPVLEESYFWRGMGYLALGKENLALADLEKSARLNSNYAPPLNELLKMGVELP